MVANYPSGTRYAWWLMERFWTEIAELFSAAGRKAYLAFPIVEEVSEVLSTSSVEIVEMRLPWSSAAERRRALQFIVGHDVHGVYFSDQPFTSSQYISLRRAGVERIVVHDHTPGDRPPIRGVKGWAKAARNRIRLMSADRVYCVSELMRQRNMRNGRIPADRLSLVQNGITPVQCSGDRRRRARAALGLPDEALTIVTTGRAHRYKRFDFVVDCADAVRRASPELEIQFLLVGDGPAFEELRSQVNKLNLEKTVRLLGFRDDVASILCASDIALHAALGEGFSLSIVEYMSASLPVLVPDIPSVRQAIADGVTGFVYPPDDTDSVVALIVQLACDRARREEMGLNARTEANSKYSIEECARQFRSAITRDFV